MLQKYYKINLDKFSKSWYNNVCEKGDIMKRALVVTAFLIVFLSLYFLQANFFRWYNIAGIKPNLFIIFILFIGLFLGRVPGLTFGMMFGFLLDLFVGKRIGLNAIMLSIAGVVGGFLDKSFSKESRITFMTMTFAVTILCEIVYYMLQIILLNAEVMFGSFMQIIMIEAVFNSVLVIILYPLIQKAGYVTEEFFNERKRTLMRYY